MPGVQSGKADGFSWYTVHATRPKRVKFSIFITNTTIDFLQFNSVRFYWKYFNIILSFFLYSLGENKFAFSNKLLPFNMKSINPIQKYQYIIEFYACIL